MGKRSSKLKKLQLLVLTPLVFSLVSAPLLEAGAAASSSESKESESQNNRYENLELFQKVLQMVESQYVDQVSNQQLIHGAINGMLATLDPHSNFLPPEVFKDMKTETEGQFPGIGVEIGIRNNVLTIIAPIEDTPAWKAGLKPGDRVVRINGVSTKGMNMSEAISHMRGKKGSKVNISIFRKGWKSFKDIAVERDVIRIRAARWETLEDGYGYIRLLTFNKESARQVRKGLQELQENAAKKKDRLRGLIFDLRTNPGGLLDQAVYVTSLFVDNGVVVSTIGRNENQRELRHVIKGQAQKDFPMVVLVDSNTASAAEIVAGALQDHNRAVVMGQTTFGKGSVQTVIPLGEKIGLKLTVQRYYTPKGRSIQSEGVVPDILLDQYDTKLLAKALIEDERVRERDLPGHIKGQNETDFTQDELDELSGIKKESTETADLTPVRSDPKEDYQVREALNYLKSYSIFQKLSKDAKSSFDEKSDKKI